MLADQRIKVKCAVIDGGMTPYELPWIVTRFIAIRDFFMIQLGRSNPKLVERFFSPERFTQEEINAVYKVLRNYNAKSVWRVFESCNNYSMPNPVPPLNTHIEYWYGEEERKDRDWDIKYVKKIWNNVEVRKIPNVGHGEYCLRFPDEFANDMISLVDLWSTYKIDRNH